MLEIISQREIQYQKMTSFSLINKKLSRIKVKEDWVTKIAKGGNQKQVQIMSLKDKDKGQLVIGFNIKCPEKSKNQPTLSVIFFKWLSATFLIWKVRENWQKSWKEVGNG